MKVSNIAPFVGARQTVVLVALLWHVSCNADGLSTSQGSDHDGSGGHDIAQYDLIDDGLHDADLRADLATDLSEKCAPPLVLCGLACVNTNEDSLNCGRCGSKCGVDRSCSNGVCGACRPASLFGLPISYMTEGPATGMDVADIDGNGKADAVVSTSGNKGGAYVFLNVGAGVLQRKLYYEQAGLMAPAVADFDGNGSADLALAHVEWNRLLIMPDRKPMATYSPGMMPVAVLAADFTGDRAIDVVVANSADDNLAFFVNLKQGDGSLFDNGRVSVGREPRALAIGDWNDDGQLDLAVANYSDGTVSLVLNNGGATFAKAVQLQVGKGPCAVVGGDFNGDTKLDLAVANQSDNSVSVFMNDGKGSLGAALSIAVGTSPRGIAVGDVSGDGKLDLVVAEQTIGKGVAVLVNQGFGLFGMPQEFPAGGAASAIGVSDFDGDGKLDVVVALPNQSSIAMLLNRLGDCE